jgi:hypothetical protein
MIARLVLLGAGLAAAAAPQLAWSQGVVSWTEDFQGEFPGPQGIWGGGYSYHGGALADPVVVEEVASVGFGTEELPQSYQISIDATNNIGEGSWGFYYGLGTFPFFGRAGNGAAQGQPGQDNPANYTLEFDLKVAGAANPQPVRGNVTLYKPDYETVYQIDLNGNGLNAGGTSGMEEEGYDIWQSELIVPAQGDSYADWRHVSLNLASLATPIVPSGSLVPAPFFEDESAFVLNLYWGGGEYGIDGGNVINFDNVALVFTPPAPFQPGDFNESGGQVDGEDFLAWQRGEAPGGLTDAELTVWKSNYGLPLVPVSAVPEPASAALVCAALAALRLTARRRAA